MLKIRAIVVCNRCKVKKFGLLIFRSSAAMVWWIALCGFCSKFHTLSSSEKNLNIG